MAAYDILRVAKNDKEAFEALVKGYKTLYPEKKTIKGWRGNDIEIDWLYMLQENFSMARMLRLSKDEPLVNVRAVCEQLGVKCD